MKHSILVFVFLVFLLPFLAFAQISDRERSKNVRVIEGVVTGIISSNNMRGELSNYDIIIKVGNINYDCRVDLNPSYSLFGKTISSERDLSFLRGKRVRASLSDSGIQEGIMNENGVEKTYREGYGRLTKIIVLDDFNSTANRPSSRRRATNSSLPIAEQAKLRVKDYFERYFTKCGDSHVSMLDIIGSGGIYQYNGGRFVLLRTKPLTEADRLNGIVWSGVVAYEYSASRAYITSTYPNKWTSWKDGSDIAFYVVKTRSGWQVECFNDLRFRSHRKISCSDIPS